MGQVVQPDPRHAPDVIPLETGEAREYPEPQNAVADAETRDDQEKQTREHEVTPSDRHVPDVMLPDTGETTESPEPQIALADAVTRDDQEMGTPGHEATPSDEPTPSTATEPTIVVQTEDAVPLSIPLSLVPSLPETKMTWAQHIQSLVVKKAFDVKEEIEANKNTKNNDDSDQDKKEKNRDPALVLYRKETVWRRVFNIFVEPASEEEKEQPWYDRFAEAEDVVYKPGKRLGKGVGPGRRRDGTMWGETLSDFFKVSGWGEPQSHLIRDAGHVFVTSSMLYARFKDMTLPKDEDYEQVRQIMRAAETEDQPRVVDVYSIAKLIEHGEAWIRSQYGASWVRPIRPGTILDGKPREKWEVPEPWPPNSVFDPSAYPSPWPLEPFKQHDWLPRESIRNMCHKPQLREYIPQHLLPKELIVHDPWGILNGNKYRGDDALTPWNEKDDNVCVYTLDCSDRYRYREDRTRSTEEDAKEQEKIDKFLENPHSSVERPEGIIYCPERLRPQESVLGPTKPPIYVVYPPKPKKVAPKQAHLYLSPAERMGEGHHSFVYRAEFEVPRTLLIDDPICHQCVCDDVKRILEEEDGLNGERRDPRWDEKSGRYVLKVRSNPARKVVLDSIEHDYRSECSVPDVVYEGPYRAVQTRVGRQSLEKAPYCEHLRTNPDRIHPLTVKVEVAAKLSKGDDDQLDNEASAYMGFPRHFFEHHTGFTLQSDSEIHHQPSPCGAIVPQFYGYYRPDEDDERNTHSAESDRVLSPILLMEDCGHPVVPSSLTADDRNECIMLLLRMHNGGWVQSSLYSRNIVWDYGPLTEHPTIRRQNFYNKGPSSPMKNQKTFRLIDFGRAVNHWTCYDFDGYREYELKKLRTWFEENTLSD